MSQGWVVLKFGGTSVAGRPQWETIAGLVAERRSQGFNVLLVCSAVAGMTNALNALADDPGCADKRRVIVDRHRALGADLGVPDEVWLEPALEWLTRCSADLHNGGGHRAHAEMLALGECLSTRIGAAFLQRHGLDARWQDARRVLHAAHEPELSPARQWLSGSCAAGVDEALQQQWVGAGSVVITQGYIAGTADDCTVLLGRGGSDTSAALLAGRLSARWVEIWTDVPGLFSADPRVVPNARLLASLEYGEALEMAASGARVIHARCIRAAAATATPIIIRDTANPQMPGTRIEPVPSDRAGVKAITCQKDMVVLLLQNLDTRREVGFLARAFDVFRQHGVSIDLVATSETTTTVALNAVANHLDDSGLASLVADLGVHCLVQAHADCVCVNLVGTEVRKALSRLQDAMRFFDDHPLLMLSLSANDLCLSLLIEAADHEALLQAAHRALIPPVSNIVSSVFGASWADLQHA